MNVTVTTIEVTHSRQARIKCVARVDMPEFGIVAGQRFHLVRVKGTTYAVKAIKVLAREVLIDGTVISKIVNTDNQMYHTTLCPSGEHGCDCPDTTHNCYHIEILTWVERQRAARIRTVRATHFIAERGTLDGNRPFSLLKAS